MAKAEINRRELSEFFAAAIRRSAHRGIGDDLSVRVSAVNVTATGAVRITFDNGDLVFLDVEHLVPRFEAPAATEEAAAS